MHLRDLPTPAVLVDRRRLLANIDRMQAAVSAAGLQLRPHAKTHKSPAIARLQIDRGAVGICCAKVGEAEVFADAGITNIRLPYPVSPTNAARILRLMDRAAVSIIVDHEMVARGWSDAMTAAGRTLDVLVKVDVGFHRCGIDPSPAGAAAVLQTIASLPGLRLAGILSHAGHAYGALSEEEVAGIASEEARLLTAVACAARAAGIAILEVSVGATPTARYSVRQSGLTEMRPGNYVFFDRTQVSLGAAHLEDCALTVLSTVVSKPAADRVILDSGSKVLSSDVARGAGRPAGYGTVMKDRAATVVDDTLLVERLSEEHATVRVLSGRTPLEPGDRVRILPNHACVVANLVDTLTLIEDDRVVDTLSVAARGRVV